MIVSDPEHQLSVAVRQLASDPGRRARRRPRPRPSPAPRRASRRPRAAARGGASSHEPCRPSRRRPRVPRRRRPGAGRASARTAYEVDHSIPEPVLAQSASAVAAADAVARRQAPRRRAARDRSGGRRRRPAPARLRPRHAAAPEPALRRGVRQHRAVGPDRGAQEQRPRRAAAADGSAALRLRHGPERARHRGPQGPRRRARLAGPAAEQQRPGPRHPGDQRRHPRLRPDRAVPARPGRLRGHGQRPRQRLAGEVGPADARRRALHRRGPPAPHDRQDRVPHRPPRRRVEPDGGRPSPRRQPRQRRHPAAGGRRLGADHPQVRRRPAHRRTT